jgi:hypothetical protein
MAGHTATSRTAYRRYACNGSEMNFVSMLLDGDDDALINLENPALMYLDKYITEKENSFKQTRALSNHKESRTTLRKAINILQANKKELLNNDNNLSLSEKEELSRSYKDYYNEIAREKKKAVASKIKDIYSEVRSKHQNTK